MKTRNFFVSFDSKRNRLCTLIRDEHSSYIPTRFGQGILFKFILLLPSVTWDGYEGTL